MSPLVELLLVSTVLLAHAGALLFAVAFGGRGKAWLRIPAVVASTTVLALVGHRWNGLVGALALPILAHLFFWTSLAFISQSLFPVPDWEKRKGAIRTLASFVFDCHLPSYVVEGGRPLTRILGRKSSHLGSGVILVGIGNTALLQTATRFSRVIGPGVAFTQRSEEVRTVVDLHTLTRSSKISALTKDAVPVEVPVFCHFRIALEGRPGTPQADFPFSEDIVRRVVYGQEGVREKDEGYYWDDYALQVTASRFQQILARFRLDQLLGPYHADQVPRLVLASALNAAVRHDLSKRNIELVHAGFGRLQFPDAVQAQRIASWRAESAARAESRRGAVDEEPLMQSVRTALQGELAQGLISGLSAAQGLAGIEPADLVTWQLLDTIESMSADPVLRPLIPQEKVNALPAIRRWLENADQL